jgi:hypothetical protein
MSGCLPNQDGTITRAEVVTGPGLRATFRISGQVPFDTAGLGTPDGGRVWDMTTMLAGDVNTLVETESIRGRWFESNYPDAGYVVPLGQGSDLLGVFASTPDGLFLLGAAAPTNSTLPTRLTYTPPVKVLQFPLRAGDTWSTTAVVSGVFNGTPFTTIPGVLGYTTQTYSSSVDRAGTALTPYSPFPVLRVRTSMEQTVAFNPLGATSFRQYQFVTECFGTVATVRSRDLETSTESPPPKRCGGSRRDVAAPHAHDQPGALRAAVCVRLGVPHAPLGRHARRATRGNLRHRRGRARALPRRR